MRILQQRFYLISVKCVKINASHDSCVALPRRNATVLKKKKEKLKSCAETVTLFPFWQNIVSVKCVNITSPIVKLHFLEQIPQYQRKLKSCAVFGLVNKQATAKYQKTIS